MPSVSSSAPSASSCTASASADSPVTPPFGSEVRQILRELGFSDDEVRGFVADGATRERYA